MSSELLEKRINALVQGVLASARAVALAAVSEAFSRNESQLASVPELQSDKIAKKAKSSRRRPTHRPGHKRSPDELAALGKKLYAAIDEKPVDGHVVP